MDPWFMYSENCAHCNDPFPPNQMSKENEDGKLCTECRVECKCCDEEVNKFGSEHADQCLSCRHFFCDVIDVQPCGSCMLCENCMEEAETLVCAGCSQMEVCNLCGPAFCRGCGQGFCESCFEGNDGCERCMSFVCCQDQDAQHTAKQCHVLRHCTRIHGYLDLFCDDCEDQRCPHCACKSKKGKLCLGCFGTARARLYDHLPVAVSSVIMGYVGETQTKKRKRD